MGERIPTAHVEHKEWDFGIKNADDEIEVRRMTSDTYQREIELAELVRQGPPVRITPSRARKQPRPNVDTRVIDIPDLQVGFRDTREGFLTSHDEQAIALASTAIKGMQPDIIVLGGDQIDGAEITTKWKPDSDHYNAKTLQMAVDWLTLFKAQLRADNPNADIHELEGNHEKRFGNLVLDRFLNLYGLRRGGNPEEDAVLTYSFLTRNQEMGIEYHDGYPNNELWLFDDRLVAIHGLESRGKKGSAALYKERYPDIDVIFHHIHRMERYSTTSRRGVTSTAITHGSLAANNGVLPSTGSSVNDRGQPMPRHENSQQGFGVADLLKDGTIHHRTAEIRNGAVLL